MPPPVLPAYLQVTDQCQKQRPCKKIEMNAEIKERERGNGQGEAVHCNERDRLASKQTNCNKAYSLLKIDEE